ncbi:hypothetical protein ADUPG1_004295, partial [Aduncisulcus paluster]
EEEEEEEEEDEEDSDEGGLFGLLGPDISSFIKDEEIVVLDEKGSMRVIVGKVVMNCISALLSNIGHGSGDDLLVFSLIEAVSRADTMHASVVQKLSSICFERLYSIFKRNNETTDVTFSSASEL